MKTIDVLKELPLATDGDYPESDFPAEDGEPLETPWHRYAMNLLIDVTHGMFPRRRDYYVGGNMFIYFSKRQARGKLYRGPDYFFVNHVDGTRERESWQVQNENNRFPDLLIELLSKSTARIDRTVKKDIYEQIFRTPEYFCYHPDYQKLEGWRLIASRYVSIKPDERGWLWCEQLGAWLGLWEGSYLRLKGTYPRFYDARGRLLLTHLEKAEKKAESAEKKAESAEKKAESERRRADRAQRETELLKALLAEKGIKLPRTNGITPPPENSNS